MLDKVNLLKCRLESFHLPNALRCGSVIVDSSSAYQGKEPTSRARGGGRDLQRCDHPHREEELAAHSPERRLMAEPKPEGPTN